MAFLKKLQRTLASSSAGSSFLKLALAPVTFGASLIPLAKPGIFGASKREIEQKKENTVVLGQQNKSAAEMAQQKMSNRIALAREQAILSGDEETLAKLGFGVTGLIQSKPFGTGLIQ